MDNTKNQAGKAILPAVIEGLRGNGLKVVRQGAKGKPPLGKHQEADGWLRIGMGKQFADYVVEAKRAVTPATLGALVTQLRNLGDVAKCPPLLVTDYLTPPMTDRLKEEKQQFADAAGNAYLTGPGLFVYVSGRKPRGQASAVHPGGAFKSPGIKVLFALICDPDLVDQPHRSIAKAAGVALGAIPKVLADLKWQGYLRVGRDKRRLNASKRMIDEWALAYAHTLRPKTLLGTYIAPGFDTWPNWKLDPHEARWGGEPAANLLVGYLMPGVLTIYADKLPARLIIEQRLVTADRMAQEHLLELRKPFWGAGLDTSEYTATVPPVLVYADLLATGDGRCIETAQMIYDGYLARFFPTA